MPSISVIVPMYNSSAYIANCILSLQTQSFTDFEAILVDDSSTDHTLDIAKQLTKGDARFRIIALESNRGPSAARNTGIEAATGEYITFLDTDDQFRPEAFERLYSLACGKNLDLIDFCGTPKYESKEVKNIRQEDIDKRTPISGILTGRELFCEYIRLDEYHVALYLHFFKRSLLEEGPLRLEEGIIHEDDLFTPLLHARAQRAMLLNEELYLRTLRAGSLITSPRGIYNVMCLFTVTGRLSDWIEKNAASCTASYVDAFTKYIWRLYTIMAQDILRCSADEIVRFQETLSPQDALRFSLQGIQRAAEIEERESSKSWQLAHKFAEIARTARRIAVK